MKKIYVIKNTVNSSVYVGQTGKTIEERLKKHIQESKNKKKENFKFYSAIRAIGADKFYVEMLEECDDIQADERERYWIKFFHSNENGGYNMTIGGIAYQPYDYECIERLLKSGHRTKEIVEKIGCCKQLIYKVAKEKNIDIPDAKHGRQVKQYTRQGDFVTVHSCINEAARCIKHNLGLSTPQHTIRKNISRCINNSNRNFAYGFMWSVDD